MTKTEYDMKNELRFMLAIFMAAIPFIALHIAYFDESWQPMFQWVWLGSVPLTLFAMKIKGWRMDEPLILVLFSLLFGLIAFIIVTVTIPLMYKLWKIEKPADG